MVENAEIAVMTGDELKIVWTAADLDESLIKDIFGFSRATLYNRFKDPTIPPEVEKAVDNNPTLREWKNRVFKKELPTVNESVMMKNVTDLLQMLTTTLVAPITKSMTEMTSTMQKHMELREEDYKLIRRNNDNLSKFFEQAMASGVVEFKARDK